MPLVHVDATARQMLDGREKASTCSMLLGWMRAMLSGGRDHWPSISGMCLLMGSMVQSIKQLRLGAYGPRAERPPRWLVASNLEMGPQGQASSFRLHDDRSHLEPLDAEEWPCFREIKQGCFGGNYNLLESHLLMGGCRAGRYVVPSQWVITSCNSGVWPLRVVLYITLLFLNTKRALAQSWKKCLVCHGS
jgi:hypothetical protein